MGAKSETNKRPGRMAARSDAASDRLDAGESAAAYPIRSVDRVCDVLDALANARSGLSLMAVAEQTGLPKSSAFRYLTALEHRHYVERGRDSMTYRLGPAFRPQHTRTVDHLIVVAQPILEDLRDKLGETTNLGLLDGTSIVHAVVCESLNPMRLAARVGDRGYVHSTALGKAISATLPRAQVESILDAAGMPAITTTTITDRAEWWAKLDLVKEQGYAVDDGENQDDGRCAAVAIPGLPFPAGLSVSAPANRFTMEMVPGVARQLRRAASAVAKEAMQ